MAIGTAVPIPADRPSGTGSEAQASEWLQAAGDFPVNDELIWLNNCGTVPAGTPMVRAVEDHLHAYSRRGVMGSEHPQQVREEIQSLLAKLLGCRPRDLAIIHNTSEGMNFISHGLSLAPGERILLLENEYPSNVYPWEHWREKGVTIEFVSVGSTPEEFLDRFQQHLVPEVRVAALSAVHWCTGMPLPLREVASLCRDAGVELVVDGAQGVGHVDLRLREWGIPFMAFSAWKWLLGPLGLGIMYVDSDHLHKLRPVFKGTESVVHDEVYLPYRDELKPTVERYMYSTANFSDWFYLRSALRWLDHLGFECCRKRIHDLGRLLCDSLSDRGFEVLSRKHPRASTGIIVCTREGLDARQAIARLRTEGIIAAARLGRVRLSPHVYLSEDQLERTVELLASL